MSTIDTDWFQPDALGIEDGLILDSQTAVSTQYSTSGAGNARLNKKTLRENGIIVRYGGWVAAKEDSNPWFEVDFIANATISSIFTQGLENSTSRVTKYSVAFGYNKSRLQNYTVDGQVKVLISFKRFGSGAFQETRIYLRGASHCRGIFLEACSRSQSFLGRKIFYL